MTTRKDKTYIPPIRRGRVGGPQIIDRTNEPGKCLWCGRKLRRYKYDKEHFGAYADNAFCTMRCGYIFGCAMASNAYRLAPYKGKD